jgi:acetylornithine aminotransferase
LEPKTHENVAAISELLAEKLAGLADKYSFITEIRQQGLMIGLQLDRDSKPITDTCLDKGLFINSTQGTVIRLLPPLNATKKEAESAASILDEVLQAQA